MDTTSSTNPQTEADAVTETEAEAPEVETEEAPEGEADAPEDGEEAPPEEEEEFDVDGEPIKVPKSLAEKLRAGFMKNQDYTQKTQTLAEQRRELETQRQAAQWEEQTKRELFNEEAQLLNVRTRLDQFQNVNWQALAATDPGQYAAAHAEMTQLQGYAESLAGQIEGRKSQLTAAREQATAISIERAVAELSKPDPTTGWDGKFDADKSKKLTDFLVQKGANPEVLKTILDPLSIKIINLAMIGDEALRKSSAALKKPAPVAKPVPQVATGKTRTGPSNPDKLSPENWLKWRQAQLQKKANPFR